LPGDLYVRWTLDGVVEIAYAIALDFATRPQSYTSQMPDSIVDLRLAYGTSAQFPDLAHRQAMVWPILGPSDALKAGAGATPSLFQQARQTFFDACTAFVERVADSGLDQLTNRVLISIVGLRTHFFRLSGRAFELVSQVIDGETDTVYDILRSPGVAGAFGFPPAASGWPIANTDPNGANLIEAAGRLLPADSAYRIGFTRFILLQQAAQAGQLALDTVLQATDPPNEVSAIVTSGYNWATTLREFQNAA
jgi:hypothetical protein